MSDHWKTVHLHQHVFLGIRTCNLNMQGNIKLRRTLRKLALTQLIAADVHANGRGGEQGRGTSHPGPLSS